MEPDSVDVEGKEFIIYNEIMIHNCWSMSRLQWDEAVLEQES